jgi:CRISPR-associated endonuclease/helicase Cas3
VAQLYAQTKARTLTLLGLSADSIATLAALHDIGKISEGFLCKSLAWVEENGLVARARRVQDGSYITDHALISQYTTTSLLKDKGLSIWWALAVGAHHGRIKKMEECGLPSSLGMQVDDWESIRRADASKLMDIFGPLPRLSVDPSSPAVWLVAGMITVADWIGSNEEIFFNGRQSPSEAERHAQSRIAIERLGLALPKIRKRLTFSELFQFRASERSTPNPLQQVAYDTISDPGIYVIEAPMGMGKTEAALWIAYKLMSEGKASGLYFALPTQVTSNRIHLRVEDFVRRIVDNGEDRVHLVHATSWLRDDLAQPTFIGVSELNGAAEHDQDGARSGRDWFASSKRAILAPFGVGTVDQALLGVVAVKHFFVRRAALAGKVVVIDEVHSYDLYTGTLIRSLCEMLRDLGCTVILLSATLTVQRRDSLLGHPSSVSSDRGEAYPLISGVSATSGPVFARPIPVPAGQTVTLRSTSEDDALEEALAAARHGACVLWVCNTIGNAQAVYQRTRRRTHADSIVVGLLHSRFPYFQRDRLENEWMTRLGKNAKTRTGCILVATQVVEQSVDLDADLLITDLAPTDMMLQRIGRLWRHYRISRPVTQCEAWVVVPKVSLDALRTMTKSEIVDALKPSSRVYSPYVLLRSLEEWQRYQIVTLPTQIRTLVEGTYRARDDDSPAWQELDCRKTGEEFTYKTFAETQSNIWQVALNDVEGKAKTRLTQYETVPVILANKWDGKTAILLSGDRIDLTEAKYHLATAKAIHRNLVKVPDWVLGKRDTSKQGPAQHYLYEWHAIAVAGEDGLLQIEGVKSGFQLRYTQDMGVRIESQSTEDTKDQDESCF